VKTLEAGSRRLGDDVRRFGVACFVGLGSAFSFVSSTTEDRSTLPAGSLRRKKMPLGST